MDSSWLLIVVLALVASAFSSGMEIAYITSNKLKIELDKKQGVFASNIIAHFTQHPKVFIATMLVGNNAALVVFSFYMGNAIVEGIEFQMHPLYLWLGNFGMLITQTLLSTAIVLVFAEFIPKALFSINPNRWLNVFAIPLALWYGLFYLFARIVTFLSDMFLRIFVKKEPKEEVVEFGRIDLDNYLELATGFIDHSKDIDLEIQIFQKALDFSSVKARDCLVPRNEIVAVEITDSVDVLMKKFIETRISKILVYKENIDHIIGYVHSFEMFKKPEQIQHVLRTVAIIPEPMPANEILELFIKQKKNMAVVVDEFGGTAGIITMEDIVEEIFGEIEDEHDKEDSTEKDFGNGQFEFSARLEIDYINEKYGIGLPANDEKYDTLGGLILHLFGDIPEEGQQISSENFDFVPTSVSDTRVELVNVKVRQ